MTPGPFPELEILLPVHNEAESIEATVREIYREINSIVEARFVLCEDGSSDGTKEILRRLATQLPVRLSLSDDRKGYSRAVRDGMKQVEASYLLCLDSDGQCDPKDFRKFWETRNSADVLVGWRVKRSDTLMRRSMSGAFYQIWRLLYRCPIHDPSCPFVLARREVIERLRSEMGAMQEGFWWEFTARVHRFGFSVVELPVNHRRRAAGKTQVYRLSKIPGIGYRHFVALFQILRQKREKHPETATAAHSA